MLTVYKYSIPIKDNFTINMPVGSKLLDVQIQHDTPFIWALVDPDSKMKKYNFRMCGTGHIIDDSLRLNHVGTFQLRGGALIFHLFHILKKITTK